MKIWFSVQLMHHCIFLKDPMERLLTNEGLGGVHGLREYYKSEILNYSKRMEEQCHSLRRQYAQKVRSITGVSTSTSSNTDEDTGTNGVVAGNCSRSIVVSVSTPKAGSNNTFAIPSSIPLSPGNRFVSCYVWLFKTFLVLLFCIFSTIILELFCIATVTIYSGGNMLL